MRRLLIVTSLRGDGGGVTSCVNARGRREGRSKDEKGRKRTDRGRRGSRVREVESQENRRRRRRERNGGRMRERAYAVAGFDPLDVTNCLLPHARLSHRAEWGCALGTAMLPTLPTPGADLRLSVSCALSLPSSILYCASRIHCARASPLRTSPRPSLRTVAPKRRRERIIVFYCPITRESPVIARLIMRTHNMHARDV